MSVKIAVNNEFTEKYYWIFTFYGLKFIQNLHL